jgi:hypothetical protein
LNRLVDLDDILYGDDDIEDDVDSMLFNPVASTISKWRTCKLLRRVHLLNRLVDLDEILYLVMALIDISRYTSIDISRTTSINISRYISIDVS